MENNDAVAKESVNIKINATIAALREEDEKIKKAQEVAEARKAALANLGKLE